MSTWVDEDVERKVVDILRDVPTINRTHHFGRPFISAYQLAVALHRRYPEVAAALNQPLGGAGVGRRNSLAQYLAKQLSDRIRRDPSYPVDGAFISNQDVMEIAYQAPDDTRVTSSLTGSGYDLSLFRIRV